MFILYFLCGVVGGVLGGMGMGGGTLLIPILTIFFKVSQLNAQAINLIAFIPMAVFALVIHLKNKLVDFNGCLYIIIPGIITCIASSFLAKTLKSEILTRCFGGFLLLLAVFQIVQIFIKKKKI